MLDGSDIFTNDGNTILLDRFKTTLRFVQYFDVLVGYFRTSGFYLLQDAFADIEKIRILVGLNVDSKTFEIVEIQRGQAELNYDSHRQTQETYSDNLALEMEHSEDRADVENGVQKFIEYLQSGKLEIRAHPSQNIHAKVYISRFNPDNSPDFSSPMLQWLGTWLINALLLLLAVWRSGTLGVNELWTFPASILALFGLRSLAMWAAAKAQGFAVRFRAWESGTTLVAIIALLFGGFFPFPGSFYPAGDHWRYRDLLPKIGAMALAGTLATLVLAWGSWAALHWNLAPEFDLVLLPLQQLSLILAVLETLIVFFPMISYNGRRLWDWNRLIWVLVSLAAAALVFLARL